MRLEGHKYIGLAAAFSFLFRREVILIHPETWQHKFHIVDAMQLPSVLFILHTGAQVPLGRVGYWKCRFQCLSQRLLLSQTHQPVQLRVAHDFVVVRICGSDKEDGTDTSTCTINHCSDQAQIS